MSDMKRPPNARVDLSLLGATNKALRFELDNAHAFLRRQCRMLDIELTGNETATQMRTKIATEISQLLALVAAGAVKFPNRKRRS
jgi:hypothetical protein